MMEKITIDMVALALVCVFVIICKVLQEYVYMFLEKLLVMSDMGEYICKIILHEILKFLRLKWQERQSKRMRRARQNALRRLNRSKQNKG